MSEIAREYVARFTFELRYSPDDPAFELLGIDTREKAYQFIREDLADYVLSLGFDSFEDLANGVSISESVEKI